MVVNVFDSADAAAHAVAERMATAIAANPALVLGLPAGRSPVPVYEELNRRWAAGAMDFSRVTTFNLDEFVGIPGTQRGSFRRFMADHLFNVVNVDETRIAFLDGMAADLEAECRRYDEAIDRSGGIDVQVLGIGANGHIGFNEPGEALIPVTHRARLLAATRQANAALFGGDPHRVPEYALTMGMKPILSARAILVIATGEWKARAVAAAIRGPLTTQVPASLLQLHGQVSWYLDRSAASALP